MHPFNRLLSIFGFQVRRLPPPSSPAKSDYMSILAHFGIEQILDVGAHKGESSAQLFEQGYGGRILSFEPVAEYFQELSKTAEKVKQTGRNWEAYQYALGSECREAVIHVAGNGLSSSLAPMLDEHIRLNPSSAYVAEESITLKTLDSLAEQLHLELRRTLLQLDVQGFERQVLSGAEKSLSKLAAVQLETSLRPVYEGGLEVVEAFTLMEQAGFVPVFVQPAWKDPEACIFYQLDFLWVNRELTEKSA